MQVGDLVQFQHCEQQGSMGIISMLTNPSHPSPVAKVNSKWTVFWVLCDTGIQCFTGNQLMLVEERKINDQVT